MSLMLTRGQFITTSITGGLSSAIDSVGNIISGISVNADTASEESSDTAPKKAPSIWEIAYYVDDFGREQKDPSNAYIRTKKAITGKFSNSVATNDYCEFWLFIYPLNDAIAEKGEFQAEIAIRIIEYGDYVVKAPVDDELTYDVQMLYHYNDGVHLDDIHEGIQYLDGEIHRNRDVMMIEERYTKSHSTEETLKDIQRSPDGVSFSIKQDEYDDYYDGSSYLFTINDTTGLEVVIDKYLEMVGVR